MIEEFEYKGIWWLPDKPERQISGTLRFTPAEGANLELIGSFRSIEDINTIFAPGIILGESSNGKSITLNECIETNRTFSFPGSQTSSFYANKIFVGVHFQKEEDIQFKNFSVRFSHLDEWVNISGFSIEYKWEDVEVIIKHKLPPPFQANINDSLRVLINFEPIWPTSSFVQKEASIKQNTWIQLESAEDKPFEYYEKVMNHIQNFLSLGITEPVLPIAIEGITKANKEMSGDKLHYPPAQIFWKLADTPKASKTLLPPEMLFTFKDISNRFEIFLRNWFKKAELLEPIYNLYFGTLYNPRMYLEHRFLSLVQAVESYHQRVCGGEYLQEKEYRPVYEALVKAIPSEIEEDFRSSLEKRLKYGNEYSLRKRLKEIFEKYSVILSRFIEDKENFIERVADTRNYLTHWREGLKEHAAQGEELYRLTQKLNMILEICLLAELGFNSEEIKDLFLKKHQREAIQ